MSAIIGGADIVVIEPADVAGDLGRRLAINTQLILREEARFGGMEDPAGGCWFLEWLTDQFVTQVEDLI
jgi:methylmalonyl-CoA mutase